MKLKEKILELFSSAKREHGADNILLVSVALVLLFGLIMLSSATAPYAQSSQGDAYHFFKRQLVGVFIGLFVFYFLSKIDYHVWKKYAFYMLFFSVLLLLLVFVPGLSAGWGTSRSWINVFGFSLQPSEFVKISFLLYLSAWLEAKRGVMSDFKQGTMPFLFIMGMIAALMLAQPDLGTLSIIVIASGILFFINGANLKHIFALIMLGVVSVSAVVHFNPYQLDRFRCFLDESYSPDKVCYQVNQALIAAGSGGVLGRGLGESRQKFMYLPEVSGDAIYPIIAEETGFIFSAGLIFLFLLIFFRGLLIAKRSPDVFGRNMAIGIVSWLSLQAMINIGGMINLIPMTGVPLPFVSHGGSSVMAALAGIGILTNISKQTK
jgi:cell division protein FtsW